MWNIWKNINVKIVLYLVLILTTLIAAALAAPRTDDGIDIENAQMPWNNMMGGIGGMGLMGMGNPMMGNSWQMMYPQQQQQQQQSQEFGIDYSKVTSDFIT